MGGLFDVRIVRDLGERAEVEVVMGNDFDGKRFTPLKEDLTPLEGKKLAR
jgi:hypothetical protein